MDQRPPEFRVKKITYETRLCPTCLGKRTRDINIGSGQRKTVNCSTCQGSGLYKDERETDVSLIEALTELGIRFILPASMKPTNEQK